MTRPRILIAGIGNIFLGDDGFGCEVASLMAQRRMPDEVRVVDYGIRGFDLAYALMDDYDVTILVDATARGGAPGTLYTIEPDLGELDDTGARHMMVETHAMNPMKVIAMVKSMGGELKRILLVGCEPETFGTENEGKMGLSEPVRAAAVEAVALIEQLLSDILDREQARANVGL
ncbi:MAG TPA: hydrogenase maturation protease [Blastocatellia bacterium]